MCILCMVKNVEYQGNCLKVHNCVKIVSVSDIFESFSTIFIHLEMNSFKNCSELPRVISSCGNVNVKPECKMLDLNLNITSKS